jgi:hypothetical protein
MIISNMSMIVCFCKIS